MLIKFKTSDQNLVLASLTPCSFKQTSVKMNVLILVFTILQNGFEIGL